MVDFERMPPKAGELLIELGPENLPSVRLVGKVVDPQGAPVAGADVSILRRNHGNSTRVKTGGGWFLRTGTLPAGGIPDQGRREGVGQAAHAMAAVGDGRDRRLRRDSPGSGGLTGGLRDIADQTRGGARSFRS